MALIIADSFDAYSPIGAGSTLAALEAAQGFWETSTSWNASTLGRFAGSQALMDATSGSVMLTKASGSNDATHHIALAFIQSAVLSGTNLRLYIQFLDGATNQCCIVFRTDGAILLTSATPAGTVLATYTGAFVQNVWAQFEFEVTINNTTGVFKVRKDGAASDSFSATALNTRPGANAYANKIQIGQQTSTSGNTWRMDDFMWFSTTGAAPNTWVGDVRAVQLLPTADTAQKQFAVFPVTADADPTTYASVLSSTIGTAYYVPFTPLYSGLISTGKVVLTTGGTGNLKASIFGPGGVGAALASFNTLVNPTSGSELTLTLGTPLAVTAGTTYLLGFSADFAVSFSRAGSTGGFTSVASYASFPVASPALTSGVQRPAGWVIVTLAGASVVAEVIQNGDTNYVYDATVGHQDIYDLANLPFTPVNIVMLQGRAFAKKTDAGARTGQLDIKSGGTTVSQTLVLSTSYQWITKPQPLDPATGVAWTAAGANAAQIGLTVAA